MFLRQPIIANDYLDIIIIIGPTINRSDASLKSNLDVMTTLDSRFDMIAHCFNKQWHGPDPGK